MRFDAVTFTPTNSVWANQNCGGVRVVVTNRDTFDPIRTGLVMLQTVCQLYPVPGERHDLRRQPMGVPGLHNTIKTNEH